MCYVRFELEYDQTRQWGPTAAGENCSVTLVIGLDILIDGDTHTAIECSQVASVIADPLRWLETMGQHLAPLSIDRPDQSVHKRDT